MDGAEREGANLVRGEWVPSSGAGRFDVRSTRDPGRLLGTFPLSDERDAEAALAAPPPGGWGRRPESERLEILRAAADRLAAQREERVGETLGLSAAEEARRRAPLARLAEELAGAPDERRRGGRGPGDPGAGWVLFSVHWSELELGLFRRVARELLAGSSVLLLGDRRMPFASDGVVRALVEAGVDGADLALLQGASAEAFDACLLAPAVGRVVVTGRRGRIAHVRHRLPPDRPQELVRLRNGDADVVEGRSLEEQAAELVRRAFGRLETLSGQGPGQVARVHCPRRVFSRFTECLLAACEAAPDVRDPLPQVDRAALHAFEGRLALGLDEGATLLAGRCREGGSRLCEPALFTNVEPRMELWRRRDPTPVLLLGREARPPRAGASV